MDKLILVLVVILQTLAVLVCLAFALSFLATIFMWGISSDIVNPKQVIDY